MTTKTDTPRTDNEDRWQVDPDDLGQPTRETVRIEFARELERENAELRAALVEYIAAADNSMTATDSVEAMLRFGAADAAARALVEE